MKFDDQIKLLGKEYLSEMVGGVQMKFSGTSANHSQQNPNQTTTPTTKPGAGANQPQPDFVALLTKAAETDGPDGADELDAVINGMGLDKKRLGATLGELTARYLTDSK
jgi:hypothetical protein